MPVPFDAECLSIEASSISFARQRARAHACEHGLEDGEAGDFALAVHEVVANSVKHGGGSGELFLWVEGDVVLGEVRDRGYVRDPMAGRLRPNATGDTGRGIWMANELCDLVQIPYCA